jgi:hypothetical protein
MQREIIEDFALDAPTCRVEKLRRQPPAQRGHGHTHHQRDTTQMARDDDHRQRGDHSHECASGLPLWWRREPLELGEPQRVANIEHATQPEHA